MTRNETRNGAAPVFANRLREAQAEAGVTNEQAARDLEVSLRTYTYWRAGKVEPRMAARLHLANYYRRPLAWFYEAAA